MDKKVEKILIIGGGESGVGAALLASAKGYSVFLSDYGPISESHQKTLKKYKVSFEEKGHTIEKIENFDLVIKSPGVPGSAPPLRMARDKGIQIISEIEFGFNFYSGKIIAITGSNGKTTTSGLLYHLLNHAGLGVCLGGNYGKSFCRILAEGHRPAYMVLELSSFQLDDVHAFRPDIGILLNITPDHLDRYEYSVYNYGEAKLRMISNQKENDLFIYNGEDPITRTLLEARELTMRTSVITSKDYEEGIFSKELNAYFDINLYGKHNLFNARCAIIVCRYLGIHDSTIDKGLKLFENVPHRMESIAVINGVKFINDSKATNVDAVFYAIDGIDAKIIWIAGGTDKGNDYIPLFRLVEDKVKALICLGLDNEKLFGAFRNKVDYLLQTHDVNDAVQMAKELAEPEEVVLLSPACASFDLFKNYIDRGDQFRNAVWQLIDR